MSGVFEALSDGTRRRILQWVADGEQAVTEIVAGLNTTSSISQPAVSQHLKVLHEAGLVRVRAEGTRRYYALDETGLEAAHAWLARLADPLQAFAQPMDALDTEVARGKLARRRQAGRDSGDRPARGERPA